MGRCKHSEVVRELKESMGNAIGALNASRRQSQDEPGDNVAVNLLSEVVRELKESMGNAIGALSASRRQSQDQPGDNVAVNLLVSSPAPAVASRRGASTSHAGTRFSPIDVEAMDDEVQAVLTSEVLPLRRKRTRRPAMPVVDEQVAPRQGYKRRRVAAVTDISQETGEGSSLQEPMFPCPVCWDKMDEPATTTCGHIFCTNCIKQAIQAQKKCPTCRKRLKMSNFHRVYLPDTAY